MEITKVKIYKVNKPGKLRAFASITLDHEFCVNGLKIMDGSKGLFVAMHSTKKSDNDYQDTYFPISAKFRAELQNAILSEYEGTAKETPDIRIEYPSQTNFNNQEDDLPF